jgi:Lrp/AsnC family leucine-responsive transcriptional regulator
MKDLKPKLIELFKVGSCTPQISAIAKSLGEASSTIHYNVKKLEEEGAIIAYKAIFDYKKIDCGYCTYLFVNLHPSDYGNPEKVAKEIAKEEKVESVDVCTGDYEIMIKLRTRDVDEYYKVVKDMTSKFKFQKTSCITSLKQVKTEFVNLK